MGAFRRHTNHRVFASEAAAETDRLLEALAAGYNGWSRHDGEIVLLHPLRLALIFEDGGAVQESTSEVIDQDET